jgi:hypothetical protein
MASKLEATFQKRFIELLEEIYPDAFVIKNDPTYIQGFPDILMLCEDKWFAFEIKREPPKKSDYQPNQEDYIDQLNNMSYASVVYPENVDGVLDTVRRIMNR